MDKHFRYLNESITLAMMRAPADLGEITPREAVASLLGITASIARTMGVDFSGASASMVAAVEDDEEKAVAMLRACYALKRGMARREEERN